MYGTSLVYSFHFGLHRFYFDLNILELSFFHFVKLHIGFQNHDYSKAAKSCIFTIIFTSVKKSTLPIQTLRVKLLKLWDLFILKNKAIKC